MRLLPLELGREMGRVSVMEKGMGKAQVWAEKCPRTSGWTRFGGKFMGERIRTRVGDPVGFWNGYGARIYFFNKC